VRRLSTLIITLAFFLNGFSQSPIDSLRQLIHEADDPKHRIDLQNSLAIQLLQEVYLEESFQTSSRALVESRKINYRLGEGWALAYQGTYYQFVGQLNRTLELNKQALQIATELNDNKLMAHALLNCGRAYRFIGILDSSRRYYEIAETVQKRDPDFYGLWQIYSAMARIHLLSNDPVKSLEFANRSLEMAKLLKRDPQIAYSLLDIGDCYRDQFDFKQANNFYEQALAVKGKATWLEMDYNESVGQLYFLQGDFENAFNSINIVIKAYEASDGRHTLTRSLIKMAQILLERGFYNTAGDYLYKALKLSDAAGYKGLSGDIHYEMARMNYQIGQLDASLASIKKAETLYDTLNNDLKIGGCQALRGIVYKKKGDFDSSMMYHQQGLKVRMESGNKVAISSSLYNIGALYQSFNKRKEAMDYFTRGLVYDEEIGDNYGVCQYKNSIGSIHTQNGEYAKALENLLAALELAKQSTSLEWQSISYSNLADLYEAKGDFKQAIQNRKLFEEINNSIYNKGTAQSLASSRTLYEIDQKDKQIEILNKDKLIQEDQIKMRNFILYGVIAIAVILALLAYMFFHYSVQLKRLNEEVQERNEEIQTQSEELLESNTALTKLNSEIGRQREEIKSQAEELMVSNEAIAKINEGLEKMVEQRTGALRTAYQELDTFFYRSSHDFRRPLTTLMGLAEVAKLSVKDQNALELFEKVNLTAINLDKMLVKLQSISDVGSHQLVHKEVLLRQIIDNELDNRQELIRSKQIKVKTDINIKESFISYPVLVKVVIENLIENAIDFASPVNPHIYIRAALQKGNVIIEVEDNGEGIKEEISSQVFEMFFRGSERSSGNGLGLYIARKAVEKLSGQLTFKNNGGDGTTFTVTIPRQELRGQ
jgi:signal transduction histidine kinase